MTSAPAFEPDHGSGLPPFPSAEEIAYGAAMARYDSALLERWESDAPVDEVEPLTDDDLLEHLSVRSVGG